MNREAWRATVHGSQKVKLGTAEHSRSHSCQKHGEKHGTSLYSNYQRQIENEHNYSMFIFPRWQMVL